MGDKVGGSRGLNERNAIGTLPKLMATSDGPTVIFPWPVVFGSGRSGRNFMAETWCGRIFII